MLRVQPIEVKLFAILRDRFGSECVSVPVEGPTTAAALVEQMAKLYPAQAAYLTVCRVAVNRQFARAEHLVSAGDEVALIPPVSGG